MKDFRNYLVESTLKMTPTMERKLSKIKIRDYMMKKYPSDAYCKKISDKATFVGLFNAINTAGGDVYNAIGYSGPNSSTLVDKAFEALAELMGVPVKAVKDLWHDNFVPSWGLD